MAMLFRLSSLALLLCACTALVPLATFDDAAGTTFKFIELNDPVMGGNSTGTWSLDAAGKFGVFDGEVKDVPSLKAPGFIKAAGSGTFPDVSSTLGGDVVLTVRSSTPSYAGFRIAFAAGTKAPSYACGAGGSLPFSRGCFKSKFSVPAGEGWSTVRVPINSFSDMWSPATGEHTKECAADADVCPTAKSLSGIKRLEIWAEGALGKVHLEVKSVVAEQSASLVALDKRPAPLKNIVALAQSIPDLSTLVTTLKAGDLTGVLSGPGPFTVFAPSNQAFAKLPKGVLASLLDPKNINKLDELLEYHLISGEALRTKDLKQGSQKAPSFTGEELLITKNGTSVTVQNAKVIRADVSAANGVVHVIDAVLQHPTGDKIPILAAKTGLSTFVTALNAGKLVTALSGAGPFTVFAPENEAFDKLPKGVLASLLEPANIKKLDSILEYHVIAGRTIYLKDLKKGSQDIRTLEGHMLHITYRYPGYPDVTINNATDCVNIVEHDITGANGVIHQIDTVLSPPSDAIY